MFLIVSPIPLFASNNLILSIGQEYVNNQSAYAPLPKSKNSTSQMYTQPQLACDILSRLVQSNTAVLSQLTLVHNHKDLVKEQKVKTIKDLAQIGVDDYRSAPQIWDAVWKELTVPGNNAKSPKRPPVLVAIDGINFWMGHTKYMSADYKPIHAHQFTLIKQFVDLLFNKEEYILPNGGMILACTTKSNHPTTPAFDFLVKQITAQYQHGLNPTHEIFPLNDPYSKPEPYVTPLFSSSKFVEPTILAGIDTEEATGLLGYFAKSGIFREAVTKHQVAEKISMSGDGIIGEICKLAARSRKSMFRVNNLEGVKVRV